jgi:AcrR family transcriptional regulator
MTEARLGIVMDSSAALPETDSRDAGKRNRILEGALTVFLAYGYQRTTMDDIARAAEMSRPSLYLQFRNKADIYRAIAADIMDQSVLAAERAAAGPGDLAERLSGLIEDAVFSLHERLAGSPHAADIMDMKNNLAADLVGRWKDGLCRAIVGAIAEEVALTGVDLAARDLSPPLLASLMMDGLEGMKLRIPDPQQQRRAARGLVRVVALAVQG